MEGGQTLDRIELVRKLLRECVSSAVVVNGFLNKPRKYTVDDSLYMREVHFLVSLESKDQPTMSEMASQLNVTPGAVTQMVSRLEKKGYVVRSKASDDKRQTTVSLTEKGRVLCTEHIAYDQMKYIDISDTLTEYSDEDLERLIHYEQLMRDVFKKNY